MQRPGRSDAQPSPSQTPEAHSVPAVQVAPSARDACCAVSGPWFGGGAGWSGGSSSTAPGSLVVGGVSFGDAAGACIAELEHAATASAIRKLRISMSTAYPGRRLLALQRAGVHCARGQQPRRGVSGHDVRRVPRAGARRGDRRLSVAARARGRAGPGRARPQAARAEPAGQPAQGDRSGRDRVGRARRPDARHTDRDADPQPGHPRQGLRRDRARLSTEPRRLHLRREVRHPRGRRRWARERPRDRRARGRGRGRRAAARAARRVDRGVGR
jgi:hypothetical protein